MFSTPTTLRPALAALGLFMTAGFAEASDTNYNSGAASVSSSTTASCNSAIMRTACSSGLDASADSVAAPVALTGWAAAGAAGIALFVVRRRRRLQGS